MIAPPPMKGRNFIQICWVVPDVLAAAKQWIASAGVGPFFYFEKMVIDNALYRGKPVDLDLSVAIAQAGDTQIELISQHNDAPSAWRDLVPKGKVGFHHMALYCRDFDKDFAAYSAASPVAFTGVCYGNRVAYIDTSPTMGCMLELIEGSETCDKIFADVRAASENWDGKTPIRGM